jgi:hypothetical protein
MPNRSKPSSNDDFGRVLPVILKTLGVHALAHTFTTLHMPVQGVRALVSRSRPRLSGYVLAYIQMVTVVPSAYNEVLLQLASTVKYPLVAKGALFETRVIWYLVAAVSGAIGFSIIYLLPRSLFAPRSRSVVLIAALQMSLYNTVYEFAGDLIKLSLWGVGVSFPVLAVFGWAVVLGFTALEIYITRAVLRLRWPTITLLFALGISIGFVRGYLLTRTRLIHF